MADKVVTLLGRDEMLARLQQTVIGKEGHAREQLLPKILKMAGTDKVPIGIVMGLSLAIEEYVDGMPVFIRHFIYMNQFEDLIDAVTDDEVARLEAKDSYKEVQKMAITSSPNT